MATKIFASGNYIILDDGVGEPDAIPTKDCRYSVINSEYTISDNDNDLFSVTVASPLIIKNPLNVALKVEGCSINDSVFIADSAFAREL